MNLPSKQDKTVFKMKNQEENAEAEKRAHVMWNANRETC